MKLFGFKNKETSKAEQLEKKMNETNEADSHPEDNTKKLDSNERSRSNPFKESLKYDVDENRDDDKLEKMKPNVNAAESDDGERGNFERSKDGGRDEGR